MSPTKPSTPGFSQPQSNHPRPTAEERLLEYKEGSIRRLRLQNFLTYADVEFQPGPRLNVVIGPNGTGKSTILCAICLGLGGQPTLLGRADDARTFIMHEKDKAFIEVELAPKHPSDRPDIIRRIIERNKGSERGRGLGASTFYINGTKSNLKAVRELVETYHIAVDNLCTFLPQDRVGSFSGFTPIDLLVETEKSIGMETMFKPHQQLQELEIEVNNELINKKSIEEELEKMLAENKRLEQEKKLMEERKEAEQKLKLLKQKQVWLQFDEARALAVRKKEDRDNCKKQLQEARQILRPLEEKAEQLKTEVQRIKSRTKILEDSSKAATKAYDKAMSKADILQDKIDEEVSNLNSIDSDQRRRQRDVDKQTEKVQQQEECLRRDFPPMDDVEALFKGGQTILREAKKRHDHIKRQNYEITSACRDLQEGIQADNKKLDKMKDEKKRRLERLFSNQPKLGDAFQWVDQNRKMFRRPIWGPIAGEISMKSSSSAAYLEQHVANSTLKSFVVECKEDYNLLYRELRTKRGIPVNINIVNNGILNPIQRTYSDEKMRILKNEHGVIDYLDESFDAPDAVLQALITSSSIHCVLVGTDKTQESLDKRGLLEYLVQREDGKSGKMNACIFSRSASKAYKYTSMVSRYSGKSAIRVDEINVARMLAPGTNPEVKERLEQELQSKRKRLEETLAKKNEADEAFSKAVKEAQEASAKLKECRDIRDSIIAQRNRIAQSKRKLRDLQALASKDFDEEKKVVVNRLKKLVDLNMTELENVARSQEDILNAIRSLAGIKMTEDGIAASAQRTIDILNEKEQETKELEHLVSVNNAHFTDAKRRMKELKIYADRIAPMKDAEGNDLPLKAQLQELPETLGEIDAAIADNQELINSISDNPQVLSQYEKRKAEIEKKKEEFENLENAQSAKRATLHNLLEAWKARLHNTVEKVNTLFSGYMRDLGCAGEISLAMGGSENGDSNFSKWGIEIRVKFREKSSLQVLSAQVQSGGERSVSTIMYLMALQELMTSPFRCVDEINQGLDERNERLVFKRIVKNSTKLSERGKNDHCGQYFLITPKLLPNLTDMENENVTILCIFNGPFNFSNFSDWNCDKFLGFDGESSFNASEKKRARDHEEQSENEGENENEQEEEVPIKRGNKKSRRRITED